MMGGVQNPAKYEKMKHSELLHSCLCIVQKPIAV